VRRRWVAAVVLVAATATACQHSSAAPKAKASQPPLHGASFQSGNQARPEFVLTDTAGQSYDFQKHTAGKLTLLYFGYTHCPDECPTSMADVAQALRDVPASVSSQVTVVFATTDPWRDTGAVLRKWLDKFHPPQPYVGLTGTPGEIAGAETTMGMPISHKETAPKSYGAGQYAVSHFAGVLVYGRDDRLKTLYPSGVTPADIATDLKVLVKG
jgi:protein SCO1/2